MQQVLQPRLCIPYLQPASANYMLIFAASSTATRPPPPAPPAPNIQPLFTARSIASAVCDTLEGFIHVFLDPKQLEPSSNPKVQLADNFAPVEECSPTPCLHVQGTIPDCLRGGAYVRNGSNPLFPPPAGYHYFDGHGMLHAVKFPEEAESEPPKYCARYTSTSRYLQEKAAGRSLFPNSIGELKGTHGIARMGLFGMRSVLGLVDSGQGFGTSNAGMVFYDGKILAMSEEDMPYSVKLQPDGDIVTTGRYVFHGGLTTSMCAHPKVDPVTGELFAFSFGPLNPHLRYFHGSPDGRKAPDFPVWLPEMCLFHDFAVTRRYAVFPENQLVMRPHNLLLGKPLIVGDSTKLPRFGVLPRFPSFTSAVKWFDVPDWTSFHCVNAWEEGEEIVVVGSTISPVESLFDNMPGSSNRLTEVHLNLKTGRSYKQHVCSCGLDFGQLNQAFYGRKSRYLYMSYYGPWPKLAGIAKVDLEAARLPRMIQTPADPDLHEPCIAASRKFGRGRFCGEPFFVPRYEGAEEDDGYVLSFVHDELKNVSELVIMDARSSNLDVVATVKLPARVPYGFHGVFLNAKQLRNQH